MRTLNSWRISKPILVKLAEPASALDADRDLGVKASTIAHARRMPRDELRDGRGVSPVRLDPRLHVGEQSPVGRHDVGIENVQREVGTHEIDHAALCDSPERDDEGGLARRARWKMSDSGIGA